MATLTLVPKNGRPLVLGIAGLVPVEQLHSVLVSRGVTVSSPWLKPDTTRRDGRTSVLRGA